jgi:hypothetical protein
VLGIPQPLPIDEARLPWGEIRPPTVPVDAERSPFEDGPAVPAQQPAQQPADEPAAARPASDGTSPAPTLLAILAATALLLGLFLVYRRRRAPATAPVSAGDRLDLRVGTAEEPVDDMPEPVEISSRA